LPGVDRRSPSTAAWLVLLDVHVVARVQKLTDHPE